MVKVSYSLSFLNIIIHTTMFLKNVGLDICYKNAAGIRVGRGKQDDLPWVTGGYALYFQGLRPLFYMGKCFL